jgi:hypothetical protein
VRKANGRESCAALVSMELYELCEEVRGMLVVPPMTGFERQCCLSWHALSQTFIRPAPVPGRVGFIHSLCTYCGRSRGEGASAGLMDAPSHVQVLLLTMLVLRCAHNLFASSDSLPIAIVPVSVVLPT